MNESIFYSFIHSFSLMMHFKHADRCPYWLKTINSTTNKKDAQKIRFKKQILLLKIAKTGEGWQRVEAAVSIHQAD